MNWGFPREVSIYKLPQYVVHYFGGYRSIKLHEIGKGKWRCSGECVEPLYVEARTADEARFLICQEIVRRRPTLRLDKRLRDYPIEKRTRL